MLFDVEYDQQCSRKNGLLPYLTKLLHERVTIEPSVLEVVRPDQDGGTLWKEIGRVKKLGLCVYIFSMDTFGQILHCLAL